MTGSEFKRLRKRNGWTISFVAYKLGVTDRAVYRWQSGKRKITSQVEASLALLKANGRGQNPVSGESYDPSAQNEHLL